MPLSRVTAGHLPALSVPGGWSFANFVQLGGRTFANPGAIPELLAHMCIPIQA